MDLESTFMTFQFPILLLLFILAIRFVKGNRLNPNLPPGPWKLPILGSIHHMVGSPPHRALRDLARKYGPLMHLQLGEISTVVVSSPKIAKEVMKTHDLCFVNRPELLAAQIMGYDCTDVIFSPYGEYWRELRKICTLELLSLKRVQSFGWIREDEAAKLIELLASKAGSPVNLTQTMISLTYRVIARAAFGKESSGQKRFIELAKALADLTGGFEITDIFPSYTPLHYISGTKGKLKRMRRELDIIVDNIIAEHQKKTGRGDEREDLVDVLLRVKERDDGGISLSLDNIKAVVFDVFSAGGDSSAVTISWAMAEMLKKPRILEKAQAEVRRVFARLGEVREDGLAELEYLKLVIKETLRFHPIPLIARECRETCEINGFMIPKKTRVIINSWAIRRDPEYWDEPETFNPDRFLNNSTEYKGDDFEYIPFGGGRRICPGINFALASVEHQLAVLLYHFDWKLPDGMKNEDLDMTESFGGVLKKKHDLYVIPIRHFPSQ